ncbi:MAG: hypothetical protein ABJC26_07915 [Gemmatimonadaceae bacterium]
MKRSSLVAAAALLVGSSSVAFALARHSEWSAKVAGKDGMKLHGTATVKPSADGKSTMVDFKIMGDVAGSVRPWHVHTGSCAKSGAPVMASAYTPITIDAKGNGEGKATLAMVVPDTGSYYVNVHESKENMGHAVACGDLKHSK